MFKLVIQDDEGKTTVVPLIRDEITIGRKEGNTIRLTERNVSRRHARILRNNGEVQIEDLGSYNGIRVNNARIAERVSLRVSDQVQIGDYKLYLKAEGVEQVDDARTMPIERVDTANTATDVIAAVPAAAAPAPTTPMAIPTPTPGALPQQVPVTAPGTQLVGNPNRTLVAVPPSPAEIAAASQGRPIASPAQVAAVLSSPAEYGKLVVLSSNFAGKEFELSRPQMIIGRTDENDIVVNHRSISRNHAKLVREPDTGRYTISDLQSSNGVRVNGQDYGKVELRRGDVIDLGHVRLRFIEPGEDFVFARDAVITDVPDTSSKKSLFIAIALAAIVVVAVVVVMLMRDDGKPSANGNIAIQQDAGQIAMAADAADPVGIDAAPAVADSPAGIIRLRCKGYAEKQRWAEVINCADELRPHDKDESEKLKKQGLAEQKAETENRKLNEAVKKKDLAAAAAALEAIGADSVYRMNAEAAYSELRSKTVNALITDAPRECGKGFDSHFTRARRSGIPADVVDDAKRDAKCKEPVAARPNPNPNPPNPPEKCDADDYFSKGREAYGAGRNDVALQHFEASLKCRPNATVTVFALSSACKSKNLPKARLYWKKLSPGSRNQQLGTCVGYGFTADMLNGP